MKEKEFLPLVKEKLGIDEINEMQKRMMASASESRDILLLSPTGSGKTLAFILPLLKILRPSTGRVQAVVIAPSRELVIQIAGIMNSIAAGFKTTVLYGGHKVEDEVNSLSVTPDIIVATPGRLLDHAHRKNIDLLPTRIAVLDEFDKSLELGFEDDMEKIFKRLKNVSRIILTSATNSATIPEFLKLTDPLTLDFSAESDSPRERMVVNKVIASDKDKLESLRRLLLHIRNTNPDEKVIVFVNHKESAERVAAYLKKMGDDCVLYHGSLQQNERESAVSVFNNGSRPIMIATDLASRGLDIKRVGAVVHYHQPLTPETFTHRNGRTARVDATGDVYLLIGPQESVNPFIDYDKELTVEDAPADAKIRSEWNTIYFSAGKKEKLSKGDILGFLVKEGKVDGKDIGIINVYDHYSLAAVKRSVTPEMMKNISGKKIKGEKRKISIW